MSKYAKGIDTFKLAAKRDFIAFKGEAQKTTF